MWPRAGHAGLAIHRRALIASAITRLRASPRDRLVALLRRSPLRNGSDEQMFGAV